VAAALYGFFQQRNRTLDEADGELLISEAHLVFVSVAFDVAFPGGLF